MGARADSVGFMRGLKPPAPSGIYGLQPSPKALLGPKTGEIRGLLFTDEYMGIILKLFIALRLPGKLPLWGRVFFWGGVGATVVVRAGPMPDRLNRGTPSTSSLFPLCPSGEISSASGNALDFKGEFSTRGMGRKAC